MFIFVGESFRYIMHVKFELSYKRQMHRVTQLEKFLMSDDFNIKVTNNFSNYFLLKLLITDLIIGQFNLDIDVRNFISAHRRQRHELLFMKKKEKNKCF